MGKMKYRIIENKKLGFLFLEDAGGEVRSAGIILLSVFLLSFVRLEIVSGGCGEPSLELYDYNYDYGPYSTWAYANVVGLDGPLGIELIGHNHNYDTKYPDGYLVYCYWSKEGCRNMICSGTIVATYPEGEVLAHAEAALYDS